MSPERTVISWAPLSFYDDVLLYALRDESTLPAITKYALRRKREIVVLDGTATPIMAANEIAPLQLSRDTVVDYARFFTAHVWHHGMPGMLIERLEEYSAAPLMAEEQALVMGQVLRPVQLRDSDQAPDAF
ncbi:MAG: hypothetical protein AAF213_08390 [Pseudomonadota bacterium]